MVSDRLHNRFKFAYTQPDTLVYKSVTFFKVFFQVFSYHGEASSNLIILGEQINSNDAKCAERCLS